MKTTSLSLDQAPPISVPFRFFLTAPLFPLAAALLALWQGPDLLASRWSGGVLALTHLFTLGFMAMVMVGALMQMLPVVAGSPVPRPLLVARAVHLPLALGAALLPAAFLSGRPVLFELAMLFLAAALLLFLGAMVYSLTRVPGPSPTITAMRLAGLALLVTVGLGLMLGASQAGHLALPNIALKNLHPAWGLLGWLSLLVIGVAYQVVPMFQITPPYPKQVGRWLAWTLFGALVGWSALSLVNSGLQVLAACAVAASLVAFAVATLRIQAQRKRKHPDVTLSFWRFAMASLILVAAVWGTARLVPALDTPTLDLVLGVLMIAGFAYSVINGMLYKIVPFLVWFHLQSMSMGKIRVPNVKEVIPDVAARRQMRVHFAFVGLSLAAVFWPVLFVYPAALALAASAVALMWNLGRAVRIYGSHWRQLQALDAGAAAPAHQGQASAA